jgi:hypothetical protein
LGQWRLLVQVQYYRLLFSTIREFEDFKRIFAGEINNEWFKRKFRDIFLSPYRTVEDNSPYLADFEQTNGVTTW